MECVANEYSFRQRVNCVACTIDMACTHKTFFILMSHVFAIFCQSGHSRLPRFALLQIVRCSGLQDEVGRKVA